MVTHQWWCHKGYEEGVGVRFEFCQSWECRARRGDQWGLFTSQLRWKYFFSDLGIFFCNTGDRKLAPYSHSNKIESLGRRHSVKRGSIAEVDSSELIKKLKGSQAELQNVTDLTDIIPCSKTLTFAISGRRMSSMSLRSSKGWSSWCKLHQGQYYPLGCAFEFFVFFNICSFVIFLFSVVFCIFVYIYHKIIFWFFVMELMQAPSRWIFSSLKPKIGKSRSFF